MVNEQNEVEIVSHIKNIRENDFNRMGFETQMSFTSCPEDGDEDLDELFRQAMLEEEEILKQDKEELKLRVMRMFHRHNQEDDYRKLKRQMEYCGIRKKEDVENYLSYCFEQRKKENLIKYFCIINAISGRERRKII